MSQIYVPGQTYHFMGDANGQNFQHVGFVQQETPIQFLGAFGDVNADYAGPAMPADVQYFGDMAMLALSLIRYNELVLNQLKSRVRGGFPGGGFAGSIGSLLLAEGLCFSWAAVSAYRGKPVFTQGAMNGAYYFPQVYPADTMDFALSTQAKVERVTLRAIPKFNTPSGEWVSYQIGLPPGSTLPQVN